MASAPRASARSAPPYLARGGGETAKTKDVGDIRAGLLEGLSIAPTIRFPARKVNDETTAVGFGPARGTDARRSRDGPRRDERLSIPVTSLVREAPRRRSHLSKPARDSSALETAAPSRFRETFHPALRAMSAIRAISPPGGSPHRIIRDRAQAQRRDVRVTRPLPNRSMPNRSMRPSPELPTTRVAIGPATPDRKIRWSSPRHQPLIFRGILERAMGFEPTTPTLARLCSTPELHPRSVVGRLWTILSCGASPF